MTEQDEEYLEAIYVGCAMIGYLINGDCSPNEIPKLSKDLARAMMSDPEEQGIVSIKKRKYERRN